MRNRMNSNQKILFEYVQNNSQKINIGFPKWRMDWNLIFWEFLPRRKSSEIFHLGSDCYWQSCKQLSHHLHRINSVTLTLLQYCYTTLYLAWQIVEGNVTVLTLLTRLLRLFSPLYMVFVLHWLQTQRKII